jgi:hypothetical protein
MKKNVFVLSLLGAMVLGTCPVSAEDGTREISAAFRDIKIIVDGKQLSTPAEPFIYNGTTYLPVRAVGEAVGKEVAWDNDTKTVTLTTPPPTIEADRDITGNLDFEISITPSGKKERTEILRVNEKSGNETKSYSLYYYGLSDVSITIDGETLPLAQALQEEKVLLMDILRKCMIEEKNGNATVSATRGDGGTSFWCKDYTIMQLYAMTGETPQDLYIGFPKMKMNELIDSYYPLFGCPTVEWIVEYYINNIAYWKNTPEQKQETFEEGLSKIEETARLYELSDEELQETLQKYKETCKMYLQ